MLVKPFIHVVFNALADIQILKQRHPLIIIVVYDLIAFAWSNKVIKINTICDNLRFIRRKQKQKSFLIRNVALNARILTIPR